MSVNDNVYVAPEIRSVQQLHGELLTPGSRDLSIRELLSQQAEGIARAHADGNPAVVFHIACWHPTLVGQPADEILAAEFGQDDARQTIAREYGFAAWSEVEPLDSPPDGLFESAIDALLAGEIDRLTASLVARPSLVIERSGYGHRSTLLHYVGSNGVETHRQVVPRNLADVTGVLIEAGADVNATAEMYGGGSTTLGLLLSSAHPTAAGVTAAVAKVLTDAGAKP